MQVLTRRMRRGFSTCGLAVLLLTALSVGSAGATTGQEIFETKCAVCHGVGGTAILPNAPHFAKGERMEKSDDELLTNVFEGLNVMPPWKGILSEQEIREVLIYVRSLAQ